MKEGTMINVTVKVIINDYENAKSVWINSKRYDCYELEELIRELFKELMLRIDLEGFWKELEREG